MLKSKILSKYPNLLHFFGDKNSTLELDNVIMTEQVHGNKVAIMIDDNERLLKGYDGMITNKPLLFGIRTADCLPIFFYDPKRKIVGSIHAGWKGLSKRIIKNAIAGIKRLGGNKDDLIVSVGPHIQICCYSVSEERAKKFQNLTGSNIVTRFKSRTWFLNLSKIALFQLRKLGIKESNIEVSDICTSCNNRFWSFRRDKQKAGRMINLIGLVSN